MPSLLQSDSLIIREVWADNVAKEFALIHEIMGDYPYISMDIEFPRIVFKPLGYFRTYS